MQNSYIERVKVNGEYYDFACDVKTVNGESLLGEGNITISSSESTPTTIWSGDMVMASGTSSTTINIPAECSSYKMLFIKVLLDGRYSCLYLPKINNTSVESGLSSQSGSNGEFLSVVWNLSNSTLTSKLTIGTNQVKIVAIYGV